MSKKFLIPMMIVAAFTLTAYADNSPNAAKHPCEQIRDACVSAGFVKNDAKVGKGLWVDCINPIIQGTTAKKSVLALPTVDPSVVTACKTKRPKFGHGKVGN